MKPARIGRSQDMNQRGLHITVGALPVTNKSALRPKVDMEDELRMVKAALLYADHAKLCSINASILMDMISFEELSTKQRLDFLEKLGQTIPKYYDNPFMKELLGQYKQLRSKRYSRKGRERLREFERELEEQWGEGKDAIESHVRSLDGYGLKQAVDLGLLEIHEFTTQDDMIKRLAEDGVESRRLSKEYIEAVSATVADASTYPLFDEVTGDLIRDSIREGLMPVSDNDVARSKETGLAADLLERLPLFDEASISDILDIRRELERPLVRFRGAIITFSEGIKNAAWDENFSFDAERVFNKDVAPVILDIEDEVRSNPYLIELVRNWISKSPLLAGGAALAATLSNLDLPSIAALSIGVVVNTAIAFRDTNKEWGKNQRVIEKNNLFFYYRAGKLLSART